MNKNTKRILSFFPVFYMAFSYIPVIYEVGFGNDTWFQQIGSVIHAIDVYMHDFCYCLWFAFGLTKGAQICFFNQIFSNIPWVVYGLVLGIYTTLIWMKMFQNKTMTRCYGVMWIVLAIFTVLLYPVAIERYAVWMGYLMQ